MEKNKSLYLKLLKAQKKIGAIIKDKKNPFFKSNYADINNYIEEAKPILNAEGLIILQPLTIREGKMALKTVIIDSESGEEIKSVSVLPENPDPQKMGSIITYFRRYAIQSMLFLQAEDDDGNKSVESVEKVGNKTVLKVTGTGNLEIPTCSICGQLMKPTKAGSKTPFYCKHGNEWGKPVFQPKQTDKEKAFSASLDEEDVVVVE